MFRVISCITAQHDFWLVAVAAIVCIATTLTAFRVYSIALNSSGGQRVGWAALTGLSAGAGIWATHFVAMLAYDGGVPVAYEPASTLASLVLAIMLSALAFMIAVRGRQYEVITGGGVLGAAIATMHYLGMSALSVPGSLQWDGQLTAASLVFGPTLSIAALVVFHRKTGLRAIVSAASILALAICALHFTAMGAVSVLPDPTAMFAVSDLNRAMLAMAIVVVTFIVLLSANAAAFLQRTHTRCEVVLRDQNERFQVAISHLPVGLSMFDAEQRLIICNAAFRAIYGLPEHLTLPGTRYSDIMIGRISGRTNANQGSALDSLDAWIAAYRSRLNSGENFTNIQELTDGRTICMRSYEIDGHKFVIGVSVGIALAETGSGSAETALMQADLALYRSKSVGRATYCFFEEDMNTRARARHLLEQDLRMALANGELQLNYQPLVNLETKLVTGFEALLRWNHPTRGLILPDEFIPMAEETGLIISIGEWVLRQACADAATWPDHIKVAINLSPVQFKSPTLVEAVFIAAAASSVALSRLELEVTETALLHDSEATLAMLQKLHDMGVRIVMDDFGTGYSSLGYLRTFPFDKIKIDRSFIATLAQGNSSDSIVQAIGGLGRALNLSITAEGVETQEQLSLVRSGGCTEMQGYLFSRPKSAAEIQMLFPAKESGEWSCDAA